MVSTTDVFGNNPITEYCIGTKRAFFNLEGSFDTVKKKGSSDYTWQGVTDYNYRESDLVANPEYTSCGDGLARICDSEKKE